MSDVELVGRVRQRLVRGEQSIHEAVRSEAAALVDDAVLADLRQRVEADLVGAGPLEPLLGIEGVTDVLVNGPDEVWLDRGDGLERTSVHFTGDAAVRLLAQRLAAGSGRRLDDASPFVDAVLPDGTRLHAALPPVAAHPTISLRLLARRRFEVDDLVSAGCFAPPVGELLRAIVAARLAFVISGGTGTGKTTLLGALLGCVAPSERLVVIEDSRELVTSHPHVVSLVARTANIEAAGAVGLAELVRQSLRMRPDRVVVGEFRGVEVVDLLAALNTGHEGGAATVHANSARDVPARFAALGAQARLDPGAIHAQLVSAFDVVLHVRRGRSGRRVLAEIGVLVPAAPSRVERAEDAGVCALRAVAAVEVRPAWTLAGPAGGAALLVDLLARRGVDAPAALR